MIFQDPVSASHVATDVEYCAMEGKDILHDEKNGNFLFLNLMAALTSLASFPSNSCL